MPAQLGGAPSCHRCEERVYFNEGRNYMSRTWHIKCFKCCEYISWSFRGKKLISLWDNLEYLPKYITGILYPPSLQSVSFVVIYTHLFLSAEEACKKQLESGTCNLYEDNLYCNQCYRKVASATVSQPKTPTHEYVNLEDPDCCPRCGKRVYFAEQMQCLNRKWHKQCLNCGEYKQRDHLMKTNLLNPKFV